MKKIWPINNGLCAEREATSRDSEDDKGYGWISTALYVIIKLMVFVNSYTLSALTPRTLCFFFSFHRMPTLFSFTHPLEDFKPVVYNYQGLIPYIPLHLSFSNYFEICLSVHEVLKFGYNLETFILKFCI